MKLFTSKISRLFICFALLGFSASTVASCIEAHAASVVLQAKGDIDEKASKAARKEAKRLKKEGWTVAPGALPLDKQLDRAYLLQMEFDDNMFPKYVMGEAMSIAENYDAAKVQAMELAKQNLVAQIESEITAIVQNTVGNQQLSADDAASLTKTIVESENKIMQRIGRVIPVVEAYRTLDNGNKEVLVRIAYSMDMAKQVVKETIREEWEKAASKDAKRVSIDDIIK